MLPVWGPSVAWPISAVHQPHAAGKETPYEEDIHVPFYIRGPGLQQGVVNNGMGSHVDLASTLVALAGGQHPNIADGQTLPLHLSAVQGANFTQPKEQYKS